MKLTSLAVLGLGLLAAPAAFAEPGPAEGAAVYEARCKMCHAAGLNNAPLEDKLATLDPAAVVEKLTTGTMAVMASGLTDEDKRNIAVYLTHKGLPADGGLPEVKAE
ncbi:MAG: cytochrome c [Hyphomonadaceae bacterium]|nr:cytochrome c [Hyphomonadaceae bacterium]